MKRLGRKTAIIIILAIVLSLSIVAAAAVSFAAYIDSQHAQRTVANYQPSGDRFSSNVLAKTAASMANVATIYTVSGKDANILITVCNFEQGKPASPFERNIGYTLKAKFVKYVGSAFVDAVSGDVGDYWAKLIKGSTEITLNSSKLSTTFSGNTLAAKNAGGEKKSSSDAYTLIMDKSFTQEVIPNLYVYVEAVPDDKTLGLSTILGVFQARNQAEGAKTQWEGYFNYSPAKQPSDYDGFNYRITGVGETTVTLSWKTDKIEMSYVSLKMLKDIEGATTTENATTHKIESIVFPVNDDTSVYDLQFYIVNITNEVWTEDDVTDSEDYMDGSVVVFDYAK